MAQRNEFSVEREIDGAMVTQTFQRGEFIAIGHGIDHGEIAHIYAGQQCFKLRGRSLRYGFGWAYKAQRPEDSNVRRSRVLLSFAINKSNARFGSELTEADRVPQ